VPNDVILEEAGLAGYALSVGYDIDSRDFKEPGAAAVVARVKNTLRGRADTGHDDRSPRLMKGLLVRPAGAPEVECGNAIASGDAFKVRSRRLHEVRRKRGCGPLSD
jgi:hypothetical protein